MNQLSACRPSVTIHGERLGYDRISQEGGRQLGFVTLDLTTYFGPGRLGRPVYPPASLTSPVGNSSYMDYLQCLGMHTVETGQRFIIIHFSRKGQGCDSAESHSLGRGIALLRECGIELV